MARWGEAEVTERKILDYLLAVDHPVGRDKAAFFIASGYSRTDWTRLRDDLVHVVDGVIGAPSGRTIGLRTIWISDGAEDPPRLVTAYPR